MTTRELDEDTRKKLIELLNTPTPGRSPASNLQLIMDMYELGYLTKPPTLWQRIKIRIAEYLCGKGYYDN